MKRQRRELCFRVCLAISLLASLSLAWCAAAEYWASPGLLAGDPENDLGDAPDSSNGSGGLPLQAYPDGTAARYPTVYGLGSPPYGPIHWKPRAVAYLGHSVTLESEADGGPDEDAINNIQPLDETSNRDGGDDGVRLPLVLPSDQAATLEYTVTVVDPLQGVMYANVWFDWNRDGDWDDTLSCPNGAPAPEWAVQNQAVALTAAGRLGVVTPPFLCWHPAGGDPAPIWMRITLSETPWPAAGQSALSGGAGSVGGYLYGETEDYYLSPERQAGAAKYNWLEKSTISAAGRDLKVLAVTEDSQTAQNASIWIQAIEDPVWKWTQSPDITSDGIGIRVDNNSDLQKEILADDFECVNLNCISGVRLWGVWKNGQKSTITKIRLRIYDDDPAGVQGADATNLFSTPYPDVRWEKEFGLGQFEETLYYTQAAGQWWWDPTMTQLTKAGRTELWQITIDINPGDAFQQEGWPGSPHIYWLGVEVETVGGEFGWQTRRLPDHFMDAAVWDLQTSVPPMWQDLRYPAGHPYAARRQRSVDLAFGLKYADCASVATAQPGSSTQCPAVSTQCPTVLTQCPAVATRCPTQATQCPTQTTWCPTQTTQCPTQTTTCPVTPNCQVVTMFAADTQCPAVATKCPATDTQCPETYTRCPPTDTKCPGWTTRCPAESTKCPESTTRCPLVSTKCPASTTHCPQVSTKCPESTTNCPVVSTKCPASTTNCPVVSTTCPASTTHCPLVSTKCPESTTHCPMVSTKCPESTTNCPVKDTYCPVVPTKCPASTTHCPLVSTKCPLNQPTQCYPVWTMCSASTTNCPLVSTKCPAVLSKCPFGIATLCPAILTQCPKDATRCPPEATKCPTNPTHCPLISTACPTSATHCPPVHTKCPTSFTHCPTIIIICPGQATASAAAGPRGSLVVRASAPGSASSGQSASPAFLSEPLSGGCPTVETAVPTVVVARR